MKTKTKKTTSLNTTSLAPAKTSLSSMKGNWHSKRHHWRNRINCRPLLVHYCYWPMWYPACYPPVYVCNQAAAVTGLTLNSTIGMEADADTDADTDGASEDETESASSETTFQVERQLKVVNDTNEEVEFFVLMHTLDEDEWVWEPAAPGSPKETISFVLAPGEAFLVGEDDDIFTANKIRIWAKSATRQWRQYQATDLWLIDLDASGQRRYQSDEMQTYTFRLTTER